MSNPSSSPLTRCGMRELASISVGAGVYTGLGRESQWDAIMPHGRDALIAYLRRAQDRPPILLHQAGGSESVDCNLIKECSNDGPAKQEFVLEAADQPAPLSMAPTWQRREGHWPPRGARPDALIKVGARELDPVPSAAGRLPMSPALKMRVLEVASDHWRFHQCEEQYGL